MRKIRLQHYVDYVAKHYSAAVVYRSPERDVKNAVMVSSVLAIVSIPALLITGNPFIFVGIVVTAVLVFLAPLLYAKNALREYRKTLDNESIFVAAAIASLPYQSDPIRIANTMCDMENLESSKEFCEIKRRIEVLGETPLEAYRSRVDETPSYNIKTIFSTIVHHLIIGSGLRDALIRLIPDMLRERIRQHSLLIERTAMILLVFMIANLLLPVILLLITLLEAISGSSMGAMAQPMMTTLAFYAVSVAAGLYLAFIRRKPYIALPRSEKISKILIPAALLVAGMVGFLFSASATFESVILVTVIDTIIFIVTSIVIHRIWARERGVVYALQVNLMRFVRDLAEYRRLGYNIQDAIIRLSEADYGPLSYIIRRIKTLVSSGSNLAEAIRYNLRNITDWTTRTILSFLSRITGEGDVPVEALASLSEFVHNLVTTERIARLEYRLYQIIALMATPMVIVSLFMLIGLVLPSMLETVVLPELVIYRLLSILSFASMLLLVQAWILGIVSGKFTEQHVAATMKYAILSVLIAFVSLIAAMVFVVQPLISSI